jgi:hypothetical protein
LHNVSLSSLITAQQWLKNKEATSASVHIPEEMVKSALKVKASTSVPQSIKTKSKWRCKLKIGILYLFFIKLVFRFFEATLHDYAISKVAALQSSFLLESRLVVCECEVTAHLCVLKQ